MDRSRIARLFALTLPTLLLSIAPGCKPDPTILPDGEEPVGDTGLQPAAAPSFVYPAARVADQVDDYHGTKVEDPYRWMESIDSEETRAWVEAENAVTFDYLETIEQRGAIAAQLEKVWDFERWSAPFKRGGRYFFSKNDGLQNQSVWYWTASASNKDSEAKVLIDPNTLSEDGTVAISGMVVSDDGKRLAYAVSDAGSDWKVWKVRDIDTGKDLDDKIEWTKFTGVSWSPDNAGFYYAAYDAPKQGDELEQVNKNEKLHYHKVGDLQAKDTLVYADADNPEYGFGGDVSEDGKWLVIDVSVGTDVRNMVYYQDLSKKKRKVVRLVDDLEATYRYIGNDGATFYFRTNLDAPRGKVVSVDVKKVLRAKGDKKAAMWKELVPQNEDALQSASIVGDQLFCKYLADASTKVDVYDLRGAAGGKVGLQKLRTLTLPEAYGTAGGFYGKREDAKTFYSFTSFTRSGSIFEYDLKSGASEIWREPKLDFDASRYVTDQVFYQSKDGTKVPMFIVHHKDVLLDGSNPTYLYGYGGFNISLSPYLSPPDLVWLEMGGVYAQPNLRGGGEYGEAWHSAGTKLKKQNVFDDFVAAAEYLVAEGWTKPEKLAIGGRSNGGLLVGASMTQRPDLFGVALAGVGVMDMLRFHQFTIGWAWVSDYGSSANPDEFEALHAYSPYHNLKPGTSYPATLVYTADHDDRVVPSHSYKFAARLQAAHEGERPVLIRIDTRAGHGGGKPTKKRIEEWADLWGFALDNLGMTLPEGF